MCGIAGFVGSGDREDLENMTRTMVHRGPDGSGFFVNEAARVFLGHRRLAIVDLEGGAQPMSNEDGTVIVVFNGEIYNQWELRMQLEKRGHRFRSSHSDTEVIVHGYEEWGDKLPSRLNGMFAFAICDLRSFKVFLARDRFGKKPLYYSTGETFLFASEVGAILAHPELNGSLDPLSLQKLFAYGFLPAPNALYRDVRKLESGCSLTYDIKEGSRKIKRYWKYMIRPDEAMGRRSEQSLIEELRHLLREAVKRRLMSDVPLGFFLSGGIDSSAVLALAVSLPGAGDATAFCIGFREPSFDESKYARTVADHFGVNLQTRVLGMNSSRDLVPTVLEHLDEPFGDGSVIPTYLLSRFAAGRVKVALSGDGGDELFAGYDPFVALAFASLFEQLMTRQMHKIVGRIVDLLPVSTRNMNPWFRIRRFVKGLSYPRSLWNPVWLGPLSHSEIMEIFLEPFDLETVYAEALSLWRESSATNLVDKTLEFYANLYLQEDILLKVDRASMMNSLEVRTPFLDTDLVDFSARLPHYYKLRNGTRKYLLKKALHGILPEQAVKRAKKGFGIPTSGWLREIPESPPRIPVPAVRMDRIDQRWDEHRKGKADNGLFLWCWLSLQYHLSGRIRTGR